MLSDEVATLELRRAMWSSYREFAGSAGIIMIEGAYNTARIQEQS
jgi:hypothetical protein